MAGEVIQQVKDALWSRPQFIDDMHPTRHTQLVIFLQWHWRTGEMLALVERDKENANVKMICAALFVFAFMPFHASAQTATAKVKPKASAEQQIVELQKQWVAAIKNQDDKRISQLQADGFFLAIGVQGMPLRVVAREAWLGNLKSYVTESYSIDDMRVSVYGDTAVVLMLFTQKATVRGQDRSAQFVITDVWVKQKRGWRVAERHSSRPEPQAAVRPQ